MHIADLSPRQWNTPTRPTFFFTFICKQTTCARGTHLLTSSCQRRVQPAAVMGGIISSLPPVASFPKLQVRPQITNTTFSQRKIYMTQQINIGDCHRWMSSYFPIGRWQSTTRTSAITDVRPINQCIPTCNLWGRMWTVQVQRFWFNLTKSAERLLQKDCSSSVKFICEGYLNWVASLQSSMVRDQRIAEETEERVMEINCRWETGR